jgi:hypothetical protein
MRMSRLVAGAAGLFALTLAAAGCSTDPAAEAAAGQDDTTIVLFDDRSEAVETFLDLGDEGFTAGNTMVEHTVLTDPDSGEEAGRAVTRFQIVEVHEEPSDDAPMGDFDLILDCTIELEDGTVTFYGAEVLSNMAGDGLVFAVIGGTGEYTGASGTATVEAAEVDGVEGATITLDLS